MTAVQDAIVEAAKAPSPQEKPDDFAGEARNFQPCCSSVMVLQGAPYGINFTAWAAVQLHAARPGVHVHVHHDLKGAVTTCLGMWVPVLLFLGHRGFAMSATLASLVTNTILSLSVEACSIFVIDTLGYLDTMLRQ